uniref:Uncharacterized protein n=1 Tax=Siphoviridae sp. ct6YY1 TaxID=2825343 RepID=A0A8S5V342_9CAUD|nr:MAG TPA: hypothetical protein [Siphoviridae sp. ct6YY1]DAQ55645.1 MAG TPA: hypothetical protein [Caudoviricetes sp.]
MCRLSWIRVLRRFWLVLRRMLRRILRRVSMPRRWVWLWCLAGMV